MKSASATLSVAATITKWLGKAGVAICDAGVVILLAVVSYEVVGRYVFNRPTVLAEEVGEYSMILFGFLSGAYVSQLGRHVRMDVVYERLPLKARGFFDPVISFVALVWCAILFWIGFKVTLFAYHAGWRAGTILFTPLAPIYALMPLGALLLGLQHIVDVGEKILLLMRKAG